MIMFPVESNAHVHFTGYRLRDFGRRKDVLRVRCHDGNVAQLGFILLLTPIQT